MIVKQKEKIIDILRLYKCFGIKYIEPLTLSQNSLKISQNLPGNYKQLCEYIEHCNLCELSKSCEKLIGFNEPNRDIYLVGVNYDFNEQNIQKSLRHSFENIMGIDFNQVYMTNIIKCNTKSISFDKNIASLCKEYFFQELVIGKPKYIFATIEACKYILKTDSVNNNFVGTSYKLGDSVIFPIYSYSFLSKNPSYKQEMERVFKKIKGLIS